MFSIIIPVWREAEAAPGVVSHVRERFKNYPYEIIIVDGEPEATTLQHLQPAEGLLLLRSAKGRGVQIATGVAASCHDHILVLHADTILPADAPEVILRTLKDAGAGAFSLRIDDPHPLFRWIERGVRLRNRFSNTPYGDQAQFFRRSALAVAGGFPQLPLMEDVAVMRNLRRNGETVQIAGSAVLTSARRWKKEGILRRSIKNRILMLLYLAGVKPDRLTTWYK